MLSEEQYALFGKFSFAFNDIEFVLEIFIRELLATPESTVAEKLASEGNFSGKLERFKAILKSIAKDRPVLKKEIEELITLANSLRELAEARNRYLHAVMLPRDPKTKEPMIIIKRQNEPFREKELKNLITQAESLLYQLISDTTDLENSLSQIRK